MQHPRVAAVASASAVPFKCFTAAKALSDEAVAVGTPCSAAMTMRVRMVRVSAGARRTTVAAIAGGQLD